MSKEVTIPIHFEEQIKTSVGNPGPNSPSSSPPKPTSLVPEKKSSIPFEEVLKKSIEYFKGDELAAKVWINKYALKDSEGRIYETNPDEMHKRMAHEIARIEAQYPNSLRESEIYDVFKNFKYLVPQGGSMAGLGNDFQIVSLSNCFVIGLDGNTDSYGAILKTDEEQVQLMKRRGGVGHDLSKIRPKGTSVMNSAITSTGVVPFMERYSNSTREVSQDGRRGALMLSISIKHPDVEGFIDAKTDTSKVTGANVSIRIDDEFMKAVETNGKYKLRFPVDSDKPQIEQEIIARQLWEKIVNNAWKSAEPGILFWDTIQNESIPDCYSDLGFNSVSTNPCGEIPLCPYDSCRLLAINLYSYVNDPFTSEAAFDYELFEKHVAIAQKVMDDIVDLEIEKIDRIIEKISQDPQNEEVKKAELELWKKIRSKCIQGRRTGIGITAEGDMLAALGLRYGTDKAKEFAVEVQKKLALTVYRSSTDLARERGSFPIFDSEKERDNPFLLRLKSADPELHNDMMAYGRRNIALLTIAPTGTTSLMTQTTSGIEPVFNVSYKRRRKINPQDKSTKMDFSDQVGDQWEEYRVFHHKFDTWLEKNGFDPEETRDMEEEDLQKIIEKSPFYKAMANDVDWLKKVEMQGAIQKWVDHSISVTVNVPNEVSKELIEKIYITAWKEGCKGVTVYRDGCRDGVLITEKKKSEKTASDLIETRPPKRPKSMEAKIIRFANHKEKWIAVVGILNDKPYEIFTGCAEDSFFIPPYVEKGCIIKEKSENGRARYDFQFQDKDGYKITFEGLSRSFDKEYWNLAKLISGIMRHGMPMKSVVELVSNLNLNDESLNTWKNGVIRALSKFIPNGTKAKGNSCPECDNDSLIYQEGCLTCQDCGYTKCS